MPAKLHDPERARALLGRVKDKLNEVKLTLKYPADDPQAGRACKEMAAQIAGVAKGLSLALTVTPVAVPPRELRQALLKHDYDLAYTHWDHDSEFYWLWPLFDPGANALAPGGSNVLGYDNDATLVSLLRSRMNERDFRRVRELTHDIHAHLHERMPLIPLWQLDAVVAVHPRLRPVDMDAGRIFQNIAEWKISNK